MKVSIKDESLKELIETGYSKKYRKIAQNQVLLKGLFRAFNIMQNVENVEKLRQFSFLHYDNLSSLRLANGHIERLLFSEHDDGIEVVLIEIDDTHYGNKK